MHIMWIMCKDRESSLLYRKGMASHTVTAARRAVAAAAVLTPEAEIPVNMAQGVIEPHRHQSAYDKGCHKNPSNPSGHRAHEAPARKSFLKRITEGNEVQGPGLLLRHQPAKPSRLPI